LSEEVEANGVEVRQEEGEDEVQAVFPVGDLEEVDGKRGIGGDTREPEGGRRYPQAGFGSEIEEEDLELGEG